MKSQQEMIYNRARTRALTLLAHEHPQQFKAILIAEINVATIEAAVDLGNEPTRLKPGPRKPGERVVDRIDVGRCQICIESHDNEHSCPYCGWSADEDAESMTSRAIEDAVEMLP